MKYLMQILLGLILLQLLQSCDYSKSRDVLWMKKNFENNAELFFCLLYTSDAADDSLRVDLGGRRII